MQYTAKPPEGARHKGSAAPSSTGKLVGRARQGIWNSGPNPELLDGRGREWIQAPPLWSSFVS